MSWFSETIIRQSEKNGTITAVRNWGKWQVTVEGCEQTGREVHAMWQKAFRKIILYRGGRKVRTILALGLGGGGELKNLYKFFPGASLTVVEHDPEMIELAKELELYKPFPFPRVICEDAGLAMEELKEKYDLIILDLFKGAEPSALATNPTFLARLEERLAEDGLLVANVFRKPEYLAPLGNVFAPLSIWKFWWNNLGLFRKKETAKTGFTPLSDWPEYDFVSSIPSFMKPEKVGRNGNGTRWKVWPVSFEEYRGDDEPDLETSAQKILAPLSVISWQRRDRADIPLGWRAFSEKPYRMTGHAGLAEHYEKRWSENARRMRKDWLEHYLGKKYFIEEVQFPEFKKAYTKSTLPFLLRYLTVGDIAGRLAKKNMPMTFYGVRRIDNGKLVSGIAVMRSPGANISYYYAGFFLKETATEPVMTGLFDYWFAQALLQGIAFIDFGNFWKKGDPGNWKGFSTFKSKFGPTYYFYPPKLYKFRFNR